MGVCGNAGGRSETKKYSDIGILHDEHFFLYNKNTCAFFYMFENSTGLEEFCSYALLFV